MTEQMILVCDTCGAPATDTVTVRVGTRNLLKDLCRTHLSELITGTRVPKRGRKPGSKSTARAGRATRTSKAKE
jgi:hypothetical protein